jgi:hypothetical protein
MSGGVNRNRRTGQRRVGMDSALRNFVGPVGRGAEATGFRFLALARSVPADDSPRDHDENASRR